MFHCPVAKLGGILKSHKGLINVQKAKQTNTEMGKVRVHSNDIACTLDYYGLQGEKSHKAPWKLTSVDFSNPQTIDAVSNMTKPPILEVGCPVSFAKVSWVI